jgi:hypothetical protein
MDFNRLYFDHQLSLIKAREATTGEARRRHEADAARIAGCIGHKQTKLGAAAACSWGAGGWEQPA